MPLYWRISRSVSIGRIYAILRTILSGTGNRVATRTGNRTRCRCYSPSDATLVVAAGGNSRGASRPTHNKPPPPCAQRGEGPRGRGCTGTHGGSNQADRDHTCTDRSSRACARADARDLRGAELRYRVRLPVQRGLRTDGVRGLLRGMYKSTQAPTT